MRRDFIIGNSAVLTACNNDDIATPRFEVKPVKPKPKPAKPVEAPPADPHADHAHHAAADDGLVDVTSACVRAGRRCLAHCVAALSAGDTSMATCARTVVDMIAVNEALEALAAAGSALVKAQAAVARDACSACQESCQAHAQHDVCKACAEACGQALAAFSRVLG
ncbi:MAG: Csp1 family four helix bundle copper storage protein [Nannocystaceae bacterium]